MKTLLRSLLSLLFLVCLIAGVAAALLYPASKQWHLALIQVSEQIGPPATPPQGAPADASAPPSLTVRHQALGVIDGQLVAARYPAEDEGAAQLHIPHADSPPLTAGLNVRYGPARQAFLPATGWSREQGNAFALRLPLVWIAAVGLTVAVVGYGSRRLYRFFTTERKPSAVCLHCNQRYEDFDATECPSCGAARSRVTVSKIGRPV